MSMAQAGDFEHQYNAVRAVVLGASGYIGRWVAQMLCTHGADVYMAVRNRPVSQDVFARFGVRGTVFELNLCDAGAVGNMFKQIRPAITFNLAGYGVDRSQRDEKTAYEINVSVVETVCKAVAETRDKAWGGQDIVHVGTAAEYGALSDDLREDSIAMPTTLYGKSKLAGTRALTRYCQALEIKGLTARLFSVYGPGELSVRLLPSLMMTAKTGKPLKMTAGMQKRDFIYVEDVAEGLLRLGLVRAQPGEIVNMATGQLTSVRSFAEMAAMVLGIPERNLVFGAIPTQTGEMEHAPVAIGRLQRLTAWVPPTGIAEGISKAVDFATRCGRYTW